MTLRPDETVWQDHCLNLGLDAQTRLSARNSVLDASNALDCCLYRPDEDDLDAEELDLGDARILFNGCFTPPSDWDAETLEDYYDGSDPDDFFSARIEPCAAPGTRQYFQPQPGDQVAVTEADGKVRMYYLYECAELDEGFQGVLIREEEDY